MERMFYVEDVKGLDIFRKCFLEGVKVNYENLDISLFYIKIFLFVFFGYCLEVYMLFLLMIVMFLFFIKFDWICIFEGIRYY